MKFRIALTLLLTNTILIFQNRIFLLLLITVETVKKMVFLRNFGIEELILPKKNSVFPLLK